MEKKNSVFTKILLSIIAVCALAICVFLGYQVFITGVADAQLAEYQATTDKQLEEYATALENSNSAVEKLEKELATSKSALAELEAYIKDLTTEAELINSPSVTAEYKAWLAAQSAVEPYDLYDDLSFAYEQFKELYDKGYDGTVLYDASIKLLVPSSQRTQLDSYMDTLERYFGSTDYYTARSRFIDDLVAAKLLTDEGGNYYSWNSTLNTKNVESKLKVSPDVAEALLGLLRMIGWDV